jgi:hypothetical protein
VTRVIQASIEGELFFRVHPQFVGADAQAANWKKIKDLLSEAIIRKCAAQLRLIYKEIGKAKTKVGGLLDIFVDDIKNDKTERELQVDLKSVLLLSSVQPSFLGQLDFLSKNGVPIPELMTPDNLSLNFPKISASQSMESLVSHVLQLKSSISENVAFVKGIMGDITRVKKAGSLSSQIYDDMIVFVLAVKKEVGGSLTRERLQELVRQYKSKQMTLDLFLQEAMASSLLGGFGEYWDYSACLYQNEKGTQAEALLLRADDRLRNYLQEYFQNIQQLIYPVIVAEKNADMLFNSYSILNDLSTLPVTPRDTVIKLPEALELAFGSIRLFLPFPTDSLHDLFSDQQFCYFYSLFKQAVDGMLRDYRVTLTSMAHNVYAQVIQRYDKSSFSGSHSNIIDVKADPLEMKQLYFRPIKVTRYLLEHCSKRIATTDLQRLAYDCTEASTRALFDCSGLFPDKTDGLLFALKNLAFLYVFLATGMGGSGATVRLAQLDYDPRSAGLDSLLAGRVDLATLGSVFYDLVPRVSEYQVDLRANLRTAVDHVLDRLVARGLALASEQTGPIVKAGRAVTERIRALEVAEKDGGRESEVKAEILRLRAERSRMVDPEAAGLAFKAFDCASRTYISELKAKGEVYLDEDSSRLVEESVIPYLIDSLADHLASFNEVFDTGTNRASWKASLT